MEAIVVNGPITSILQKMAEHGAERFLAKQLAANDNSKNQVYLGGSFHALTLIPHGSIADDPSLIPGAVRDRSKAAVDFWWLDEQGISPAPKAQLILYPKYPEVRMSGFLQGAQRSPNSILNSRDDGRVLFLGICSDGRVIGHAVRRDDPAANELISEHQNLEMAGVFLDLQPLISGGADSKKLMLQALLRVHQRGWIPSQRLTSTGHKESYSAPNGGGYTLEAELGIKPNGLSEPDFLGWEVKQYGVRDFEKFTPKSPITLMTPEPDGGIYVLDGPKKFIETFGYPDKKGRPDRMNFGGIYKATKDFHKDTGLKLVVEGFDVEAKRICDFNGCIALINEQDLVAASWSFDKITDHWKKKHSKAVYVPSRKCKKKPDFYSFNQLPDFYCFGQLVDLCEGADLLGLIHALSTGIVYVDPAHKIGPGKNGKLTIQKRSQFRVLHSKLENLYQNVYKYDCSDLE